MLWFAPRPPARPVPVRTIQQRLGKITVSPAGGGAGATSRRRAALRSGRSMPDFMLQFVERRTQTPQDFCAGRRDAIDARIAGFLRFGRTQPSTTSHAREQRIERAGAQPVSMALQFLEHPLPVHALLLRVMQDVNLPERQQELTNEGRSSAVDLIRSLGRRFAFARTHARFQAAVHRSRVRDFVARPANRRTLRPADPT